MTRYKFLREEMGCDPLTAGFISFMNCLMEFPENEIRFMNTIVEWK